MSLPAPLVHPLHGDEPQPGPRLLAYHVCWKGPELCKRVLDPPWASSELDLVRHGLALAWEYG
ncbi:MAG: hypothetical protein ACREKH_04990, partial [Candidatus Rokuibacteriota bacterium]